MPRTPPPATREELKGAQHARLMTRFGVKSVVELTVLAGYCSIAVTTMSAHGIPLPADAPFPL